MQWPLVVSLNLHLQTTYLQIGPKPKTSFGTEYDEGLNNKVQNILPWNRHLEHLLERKNIIRLVFQVEDVIYTHFTKAILNYP
jgi:hypothetical protein